MFVGVQMPTGKFYVSHFAVSLVFRGVVSGNLKAHFFQIRLFPSSSRSTAFLMTSDIDIITSFHCKGLFSRINSGFS